MLNFASKLSWTIPAYYFNIVRRHFFGILVEIPLKFLLSNFLLNKNTKGHTATTSGEVLNLIWFVVKHILVIILNSTVVSFFNSHPMYLISNIIIKTSKVYYKHTNNRFILIMKSTNFLLTLRKSRYFMCCCVCVILLSESTKLLKNFSHSP